jgi:HEAT repeat protein
MRLSTMLLASAAVGAGAIGAATTFRSPASAAVWSMSAMEHERPGPDSARVATLFASLQAGDPVVCELIADQVGNFWNSDHSGIGKFSGSVSLQTVKDSISGHVTDARAITLLEHTLNSPNTCVRRLASKMLGNSAQDPRRLIALLTSSDPLVRESAAFAAGHRDSLKVRSALETALEDRVPAVAAMAAWALGEGEDAKAIPALIRAAKHGDAHVRVTAVWALGNLTENEHESQSVVLPVIESALNDRSIDVQRVAAEAFTSMEELHTAPRALVNALGSSDTELRYYAARALAEIADSSTTRQLVSLVSDGDRELRKSAVEALGKIGTHEAIVGLTRALNDKNAEVRKAAVEALGETKDR